MVDLQRVRSMAMSEASARDWDNIGRGFRHHPRPYPLRGQPLLLGPSLRPRGKSLSEVKTAHRILLPELTRHYDLSQATHDINYITCVSHHELEVIL